MTYRCCFAGLTNLVTLRSATSYPSALDKLPFETVAGLISAPLDELKGLFQQFPSDEGEEAARKNQAPALR